jgi:hypothetical protein
MTRPFPPSWEDARHGLEDVDRPMWMHGEVEMALKKCMENKWRDSLDMAVAELQGVEIVPNKTQDL